MTQKEFIKVLDEKEYSYKEEGGRLLIGRAVVNKGEKDHIWLNHIEELPSGVTFVNNGHVWLSSLRRIPSDVIFANTGPIQLNDLLGTNYLRNGVFPFSGWEGNISGIDSTLLLNKMIADGLFNR